MDWFKFYGKDFLADLKLRKLSVVQRLMFVCLLCHASDREDGIVEHVIDADLLTDCNLVPGDDDYKSGIGCLDYLEKLGVIKIEDNHIVVLKYQERQQTKLSNAERQQRFRDKRNIQSNGNNKDSVTKVTPIRVDKIRVDKSNSIDHIKTFETFWKAYPRKIAKVKARDIWKRKNLGAIVDEIVKFIEKAKRTGQWSQTQYIPHPSTFLNQQRWEDDLSGYQTSGLRGGGATI